MTTDVHGGAICWWDVAAIHAYSFVIANRDIHLTIPSHFVNNILKNSIFNKFYGYNVLHIQGGTKGLII